MIKGASMDYENIDITELLKYSVVEILKRYPDKIIKFEGNFSNICTTNRKIYNSMISEFPEAINLFKNISEFLYMYKFLKEHTIEEYIGCRVCSYCHKKLIAFKNYTKGYGLYCSTKCSRNSPLSKQRYTDTLIRLYGDAHYNNSEKNRLTCQEKYGCDNVFQLDEIKKKSKETKFKLYGDEKYTNREKRKETCIERYGVAEPTQNKQIYEKAKTTLKSHYGVETPMQSEELMNRWKTNMINLYKTTNMQHAGRIKNNEVFTKSSKDEERWLDFLKIKNDVEHRQFSIGKYLTDGYVYEDGKTKVIYEFLGDYWHGNPAHLKVQSNIKDELKKRFDKTLEKLKFFYSQKYVVYYIWEHDWKYDRYLFGRLFDGEHLDWDDEKEPMDYPLYMYPYGQYPHHIVKSPYGFSVGDFVNALNVDLKDIPEEIRKTNFFDFSRCSTDFDF